MDTLTPSDHDLLAIFIDLDEDFSALAAHTKQRLLDLYAWAALPHIRAYIDFHREHQRYLQERAARKSLHDVVTTNKDPTERRRAATTLLRALREPRPARRASLPQSAQASTQRADLAARPATSASSPTNPTDVFIPTDRPPTPEEAMAMAEAFPALIRELIGSSPPPPTPRASPPSMT